MRRIRRALFIGRFQPYHLGHHYVVKNLVKRFDEVLIVIGSPPVTRTRDNPLRVSERKQLVHAALAADGLTRKCRLFTLMDVPSNEEWVSALLKLCPPFHEVFSNHAVTLRLLRARGFPCHETGFWHRISATRVRALMRAGGNAWKKLVLPAVVRELNRRGLVEIIKDCARRPDPPPLYPLK